MAQYERPAGLTRAQVNELASLLGHTDIRVEPTKSGRRWSVGCGCGWGAFTPVGQPTVTAATEREAVNRAIHHIESQVNRVVQAVRQAGSSSVRVELADGTVVSYRLDAPPRAFLRSAG